jgi:drug/metabolite transporter (DMT)-like permease
MGFKLPLSSRIPPILVLVVGILAASTGAIFARFAQENAPSLVIAAYRLSIAVLILTPVIISRRKLLLIRLPKAEMILVFLSGLFLALHFAFWISSLEYTSVASSVVLVSTTPLWVALLSPFILKEPLNRLALLGMALSLVGGLVIAMSDSCFLTDGFLACPTLSRFTLGTAFQGDLFALIGAIMAALYLIIGRKVREKVEFLEYIYLVYGIGAFVLVLLVLVAGQTVLGFPPITYIFILMLAIVPQLIGHSSINWSLRHFTAAYVSVALLGEPVASSIWAFMLLDETPSFIKIMGAALILLGIYFASRGEKISG